MQEFYKDILNRNPKSASPIEKVILWECAEEEAFDSLHERRIRQMLEDIRDRTEAATASDGRDWVVATLEGLLNQASSALGDPMTEEERKELSPLELHTRRTAQRNRPAAEAYEHRKHGKTCQNKKAERQLLRLYESIIGRLNESESPDLSHAQTLRTLIDTHHRVFSRKLTGLNQYRYYSKQHLLGTADTQMIPGFPTTIRCGSLILSSSFDADTAITAGMFRDIVYADDPTVPAARLTWMAPGLHRLEIFRNSNSMTVRIQKDGESYQFYTESRCIAELISLPGKQQLLDWDVNVCMRFHAELPVETQVLLMSFHMLCIGL